MFRYRTTPVRVSKTIGMLFLLHQYLKEEGYSSVDNITLQTKYILRLGKLRGIIYDGMVPHLSTGKYIFSQLVYK